MHIRAGTAKKNADSFMAVYVARRSSIGPVGTGWEGGSEGWVGRVGWWGEVGWGGVGTGRGGRLVRVDQVSGWSGHHDVTLRDAVALCDISDAQRLTHLVAKSQARRRRHALQCHTSDRRLRQSCLEAAGSGRTGPVPASPCRRACLSLKIEEGSYRAASPTARSMYPGGPHVHEFASPVQIG